MQKRLVAKMSALLEQANFTRVDPANFHVILTKDSHYGLDLQVDVARLRGDADLLSRRDHHHRAASRHQEGLPRLEGE